MKRDQEDVARDCASLSGYSGQFFSWCLKHLCATMRVKLPPFVPTYIPGTHLTIAEHGIPLSVPLGSLPFQRPVSHLLSLPSMARTSDSSPLAAQISLRLPTIFQPASSGFQPYQQYTLVFSKRNVGLTDAQAGEGVLQNSKAF